MHVGKSSGKDVSPGHIWRRFTCEPSGFRCKLRLLGVPENTLGENKKRKRFLILYTAGYLSKLNHRF